MDTKGCVISFHDIHYTVEVRPGDKLFGKKQPKEIIKGVEGIFKPGLNAILGPTGSGKSSLLDILAGRKNPTGLSGDILVDGAPQPKNFKCMTGYVVQDDVVMGTLTVKENFMFSANLRLPTTISKEEKEGRVNDVIRELGLTACADTKVGTEFIRGISGGERKRTNIGMELIIAPSVLFLDEPTTGLDASTANAVIALLRRLAKRGKTIILSIHQPRYSIYRMFDSLMLLSLGKTVYHGPADEALDFFSEIGYECEAHNNPPDFFLDVINGDSTAIRSIVVEKSSVISLNSMDNMEAGMPKQQSHYTNGGYTKHESDIELHEPEPTELKDGEREEALCDKLNRLYLDSNWWNVLRKELQGIHNDFKNNTNAIETVEGEYATGYGTQFKYLSKRATQNAIRNPQTTVMQFGTMVLFGLVVGLLYLQISNEIPEGLQNRVGGFFFLIMNMIFSNMPSVELFIKERAIFIHENSSGFYRVSTYYISKVLCDLIPLRVTPVAIFSVIVYFMMGFQVAADKFFLFMLVLVLTSTCSASVGIFVGSGTGVFVIAQLFIAIIYVFMMVFGGFLVNLDSVWAGIRWLQYLSMFKYAFNALCINELKGLEFYRTVDYGNGTEIVIDGILAGENYMDDVGIPYDTDWDFYSNILALFLMIVGFLILGYVMLRRAPKWK